MNVATHQDRCGRASGHCFHVFEHADGSYEECCACRLRRNEKATAGVKQEPLL